MMNLHLTDRITTSLPINRVEFVRRLELLTESGNTTILSDFKDNFSKSDKKFKGKIDLNKFKIKKRRKLFDTNFNVAVANGEIKEDKDSLMIEIDGFANSKYILFPAFLISLVFFLTIFFSDQKIDASIISSFLKTVIFISIIYILLLKQNVKLLKDELENDFVGVLKN
ncbi:hypothetical protein I5M32_04675 [Pedobacter sp. SD-b]|uniref:Uncharacterized protein n=1 Tax=Pedobacter segetis TaxID=2793069 RepID=A0ABS1BHC7_9SPHI|nr:hypothetical protein [Pedobacter segetis]MBK0382247.1 hypothetical protein [Pedobacter segetis]